jgi:hypothetical protein
MEGGIAAQILLVGPNNDANNASNMERLKHPRNNYVVSKGVSVPTETEQLSTQ